MSDFSNNISSSFVGVAPSHAHITAAAAVTQTSAAHGGFNSRQCSAPNSKTRQSDRSAAPKRTRAVVFRYRLRGADGVIVIAVGDSEFFAAVRELKQKFGPRGWCALSPVERVEV